MAIFLQLLVGCAVSLCNIAIHAMVMDLVVQASRNAAATHAKGTHRFIIGVMMSAVSVLMIAHVGEVFVWSLAYLLVGAAPKEASTIYFAFVNYTTLGYGDVIPVKRWELLGPFTAMNGVLLFGWSTAVIFEVLRRAIGQSPAESLESSR